MNRYQDYAMKNINIECINTPEEGLLTSLKFNNGHLTLEQNENYNITKYKIAIVGECISKVEYEVNYETLISEEISQNKHLLNIDFENRFFDFKIYIKNDLVDPITITIEHVHADIEKYDLKIKKEQEEQLVKKANVVVNAGASLINVSFQPVNEKYTYSKVELYKVFGPKIISGNKMIDYQLMGKYKVDGEIYYHSITGLAYGKYAVILLEYDKENNVIYKTDYIIVNVSNSTDYLGHINVIGGR